MTESSHQPAEAARGRFFSFARRLLPSLYRFVRHELRYRVANGDLVPEELTPEDVVDAVMLQAYRESVRGPARRRSAGWLIRLASEHIEAEVQRLQALRDEETTHIEEDVPETPPEEEVTTLGEEILYFYQPDEDLKLEDVIPDLEVPTPEEVAEDRELRQCVSAALAEMPAGSRRALLLHHAEGLGIAELGDALGQPKREIEQLLDESRGELRRRLEEAGCRFSTVSV